MIWTRFYKYFANLKVVPPPGVVVPALPAPLPHPLLLQGLWPGGGPQPRPGERAGNAGQAGPPVHCRRDRGIHQVKHGHNDDSIHRIGTVSIVVKNWQSENCCQELSQ